MFLTGFDRLVARSGQAALTRVARGPFWLASTSNVTGSPPFSESKLSELSRPPRWEEYYFPFSAAREEVLLSILRGDEPEAAVVDDLLDGSVRHCETSHPSLDDTSAATLAR